MAYFLIICLKAFNLNVMKTLNLKLERVILLLGLIFISCSSYSQDVKPSRQEQKAAKRDRQYYNFQVLDTMIQNKNFILEADYLENEFGTRRQVQSNVNFIKIDSTEAVLQTGNTTGMGFNGVGGATAQGTIQGLKIDKNLKNLSFFLRFTVVTDIGIYDVAMTVNSDRYARATISGLSRGKLVYVGRIQNSDNSGFYKGHSTI